VKRATYPYPLSVITYCAHCERLAKDQNNPGLRTTLTGCTFADGVHRYRHRLGIKCGCENRTVCAETLEADVAHLIELFAIAPSLSNTLLELAQQSHAENQKGINPADFEREK
jgi:hypothetical protein